MTVERHLILQELMTNQLYRDRLPMRCAMLQLWANAVAGLLPSSVSSSVSGNKLRDRFRKLVGRMTEAELSERSMTELARQLHCSERHFSCLFREEFGVPFRARQIELRLQRARRLLADSDVKIINVARDSGYQHLGHFNAMFKKRFGIMPSKWRQQNLRKDIPIQPRNQLSRFAGRVGVLLAILGLHFISSTVAQTNLATMPAAHYEALPTNSPAMAKAVHSATVSTNAGRQFEVENYLVMGDTILLPAIIGQAITNADGTFGADVTFDGIRAALTGLQTAYRERGYVTVSVGLPQQKLTNATVKVQVKEGQLAAINVIGNRYFSSNNVMRALPSLHTNMLLNSHIFQRELDTANASRDRQIYPVIGPGPEPGTSELTLKVKDQLPLHMRLELNNQATPNTPNLRANLNLQYDNLWDLEHQIGLQYTCAFEQFKGEDNFVTTPFDDPLVANYSIYYRLPLGGYSSVQEQVDAHPGSFGYSEVTHKFNLPSATGRPELTLYASRATTDTGLQRGPSDFLAYETSTNNTGDIFHPLSILTNSAGQNVTLNEDVGSKLTLPLPQLGKITTSLSFGADFKRYQQASYNTNENFFETQYYDQQGQLHINDAAAPQPQTAIHSAVDYFPLNIGLNGSIPDGFGATFFNAQANFNILPIYSEETQTTYATNITATATNVIAQIGNSYGHSFSDIGYANARNHYVTLQFGADRVQTIYKGWSVKLHADGQWANGALFSNEQYVMGGMAGVRGYTDGQASGDTGWRFSIEPQTPLINIGMVGNEGHEEPCWFRASVFMDYGQLYLLDGNHFAEFASFNGLPAGNIPNNPSRLDFWGVGWGITANIGEHCDARLTMAFPLIDPAKRAGFSPANNLHIYFGVGAQF